MEALLTDQLQGSLGAGQARVMSLDADFGVSFGERTADFSEQTIVLTHQHTDDLSAVIKDCVEGFEATEPTLVQREYGVPSLVVRADFTVTKEGIQVYECEERPAGLGIAHVALKRLDQTGLLPGVAHHYGQLTGDLPHVVRHPNAAPNDDGLVFSVTELAHDGVPRGPLLFRGEPGDLHDHPQRRALIDNSVSTVTDKGSKRHTVTIENMQAQVACPDSIPETETSFVIKPTQGSKTHGVYVYLASADRQIHGKHGTVTYTKAVDAVKNAAPGTMLVEGFKPPIPVEMPDGKVGNLILRAFALVHPNHRIEVIGGTFVARKEVLVHGASNAINGSLVIENGR